ncbi:MAG: DNA adenine methylase [Oscillospiraceae bacterium]|nr:DNA adenine methylase [Oscillospiraceae bacterium]
MKDQFVFFENAKPFVKWVGGKTQVLDKIRTNYPERLGQTINKYAEPFVGGGAVLFDILNNYDLDEVYISDINFSLIAAYLEIRDNADEIIERLYLLETKYLSLSVIMQKEFYYAQRRRYNELNKTRNNQAEIASLFIFLNKTCFNGLYRVNGNNEFNVPMGSYDNPKLCDSANLYAVSKKLQNVQIVNADYKGSLNFIDERTFVYFDPPYRPLTKTASFTSYSKESFDDISQRELAHYVDIISQKGAAILLSNSDPKNTNEEDNFFDELYDSHNIKRIRANRMINSDSGKRGKISELLISNF